MNSLCRYNIFLIIYDAGQVGCNLPVFIEWWFGHDAIGVRAVGVLLLRRQRREMSAHLEYRGSTKLKGKGYMSTYFFNTGQVNFLNANVTNNYG